MPGVTPLLGALGVRAGTKLLDVACGPGYLGATAASLAAEVIGIDFAPNRVELAKELHPSVRFEVGDAVGACRGRFRGRTWSRSTRCGTYTRPRPLFMRWCMVACGALRFCELNGRTV
ncbi:class I SAM-dependent methyltransferase [Caballeronia grimmiae]|uniref:class I SAM-dependent methyltransferase n=1 Tax=Caballeronia grimmiae TaxID=1071679 RepID=UPI0038BA864D